VVIGAHSHTALTKPIMVHDRTPVVQTGKYGENLGELVITLVDNTLKVDSYQLYPIDDSIPGDAAIAAVIDGYKKIVTETVFASRGYAIDQPLAMVAQDIPNTYSDIAASTLLANLCTDAFRKATGADIAMTSNGMMRSGLKHGKTGVQTVYDVFSVAPLGAGVNDTTAGSTLVTGYFTARELKNMLEFFVVDNPAHPGEYFPRCSGLRFTYDPSRSKFDAVTSIELGDIDHGYKAIDITDQNTTLYSLSCPMYFALVLVAVPRFSKGALALVAKNKDGKPLESKVEAVLDLRYSTPDLLPPKGSVDTSNPAPSQSGGAPVEIKEWQAIMDHMRALPVATASGLPMIQTDARANEVRFVRLG
jgi:5'-nucleotidase / UDP-sugar diphosphatase